MSVNQSNNGGEGMGYRNEIKKSLHNAYLMTNLETYKNLENEARLDDPGKFFTYVLLDARRTNNLPEKVKEIGDHACWITFVNSIFYVGKGTISRQYSHLKDAHKCFKKGIKTSNNKKIQHILNIWSEDAGVVPIIFSQNVSSQEALTYEASMIDALGVPNLTNEKRGTYYGTVATWPLEKKIKLGVYLLYKSMSIFLIEGERPLRPNDL